jgi:hypothetical protein
MQYGRDRSHNNGSTSVGDSLDLTTFLGSGGINKQLVMTNELTSLSFTKTKVLTKRKNKSVMEHLPGWQQLSYVQPVMNQDTATE